MPSADYLLKIQGIEGECQDEKHKGEIVVENFSWEEAQSSTPTMHGVHGAGKVTAKDFHFTTTHVTKASPKLMEACASAENFKEAVLTCRKAGKGQQDYLKYKFSDVIVSFYKTAGSGSDSVIPRDDFTLRFGKLEIEYSVQKPDGSLGGAIKGGWDFQNNKKP